MSNLKQVPIFETNIKEPEATSFKTSKQTFIEHLFCTSLLRVFKSLR